GAGLESLCHPLLRHRPIMVSQIPRPMKCYERIYIRFGQSKQCINKLLEVVKSQIMLKERGVEVIRNQKISYAIEPAANLAPQSLHVVRIGPDPLLIISEYGDLECALINEFEQMPGMRCNPTPCVVGGDPTEAELFPHHWPLVEVSHEILDPL